VAVDNKGLVDSS